MDWELIGSLMQTFMALIAVLILAYVVLRFTKRISIGQSRYIEILEKVPLHNQTFLAVVRVGQEYFLASVTSSEVKILKEVSKEDMEALLVARSKMLEENPLMSYWKKRKHGEE